FSRPRMSIALSGRDSVWVIRLGEKLTGRGAPHRYARAPSPPRSRATNAAPPSRHPGPAPRTDRGPLQARRLRRRRRGPGASAGLHGHGRGRFRRVRLLRPALRAVGRAGARERISEPRRAGRRRPLLRSLHTMVRVADLEASLHFYRDLLGLVETRRMDSEQGRFTLVYLAAPDDEGRARTDKAPELELTFNWDPETYSGGRNFGHLAYGVPDIYA